MPVALCFLNERPYRNPTVLALLQKLCCRKSPALFYELFYLLLRLFHLPEQFFCLLLLCPSHSLPQSVILIPLLQRTACRSLKRNLVFLCLSFFADISKTFRFIIIRIIGTSLSVNFALAQNLTSLRISCGPGIPESAMS